MRKGITGGITGGITAVKAQPKLESSDNRRPPSWRPLSLRKAMWAAGTLKPGSTPGRASSPVLFEIIQNDCLEIIDNRFENPELLTV